MIGQIQLKLQIQPSRDIEHSAEHFYFKEKPDALQSAIRMGLPLFNRVHPDFSAIQVLNTVLGGYTLAQD